jgi:TolA-binding protein
MGLACRCILIGFLLLLAGTPCAWAASTAETRAFEAAAKAFQDGFYREAEADFGEFAQKYPGSTRLSEAVLFQAEARVKQGKLDAALSLLDLHQAQAGKLADEYLFCRASALLQKQDFAAAADQFARLTKEYPGSNRQLDATVLEATARARLADWLRVVELLQQTNGIFQTSARANPGADSAVRGHLLLGEAHLALGAPIAAERVLEDLGKVALSPDLSWQRQYLLCRILLSQGRVEVALAGSTNLLGLAAGAGKRELQAESNAFQASLLERLGRPNEAIAIYQNNLAEGFPADRQRQALLKVTDLCLAQMRVAEAAQVLEKFLQQFPGGASADLAWLTLGELRLRQHTEGWCTNVTSLLVTNVPAGTNCLQLAGTALQTFSSQFPQSALLGRAQLALGWCYWHEGRIAESEKAFQSAAGRLPKSLDQATAMLKLADAQFRQSNYVAAVSNYLSVVDQFNDLPDARAKVVEPALYQAVQAGARSADLGAATNALAKLLAWFPTSPNADRAVLLTAQEIIPRDPPGARKLLAEFQEKNPQAPLRAELGLAIARTYEQENHWTEAIRQYDQWLTTFTNHEAQAQAEYGRARANSQANLTTNAFTQFTNFVARFPTNEFAPLAQWWIADHYFSAGNFEAAEMNYKNIFLNTNWTAFPLFYEARMMAGRSAFAREAWNAAKDQFTALAADTNRSETLRAEALFAYGDTLISQYSTNNSKLGDYRDAFDAFNYITRFYTNTPQAILAWGAKAKCLLQLAQSAQDYASASNAFHQVISAPQADATARSIAEVGLAITLEKLAEQLGGEERTALLQVSLTHCLSVFYRKHLRDGEEPDAFWTRKAGLDAARLAEKLNRRAEAINLYHRLQELFPPLKYEDKINALKGQTAVPGQKS